MRRRLYLVRHGQTDYNATGRMQGQLDTSLSEAGHEQARSAAKMLEEAQISRIVASDLDRALTTARYFGEHFGVPVTADARLRETDLGHWQGMAREEVDEQFPGDRARWRNDATWAPPEGESRIDVANRTRPVVDELMETFHDWDDGAVLIVAHNGAISALTCELLGLNIEQYPLLSSLKNTHWGKLVARPHFDPQASPDSGQGDSAVGDKTNARWYLEGWNMGPGH